MTDDLGPGPRDHLVTEGLARSLHVRAGRDARREAARPCRGTRATLPARDGGAATATGSRPAMRPTQARKINALVADLGDDGTDQEIALPARVLHGIQAGSPLSEPVALPPSRRPRSARATCSSTAKASRTWVRAACRVARPRTRWTSSAPSSSGPVCGTCVTRSRALKERGGRVRVITTTYMGATEKRAVDELVEARRRGPRRVRRAHNEAPRESVAARTRLGAEHRIHRLVEPLAHRAVRRPRVERAAVVDGRGARHRPRADDVREPLGVRALRALRPGRQRRRT